MTVSRILDTPIGPLLVVANDRGITNVFLPGRFDGPFPVANSSADREKWIVDTAEAQLKEYFAGHRRDFNLPLRMKGGEFQTRAWRAIANIPYGEVISYGKLAARAGAPNANRAAGAACGANEIAVIIPCHRVIGADRSLHGYGGGLETKRWLLEHEGVRINGGRVELPATNSV